MWQCLLTNNLCWRYWCWCCWWLQEDADTTVIHKIVLTGSAGEVFNVAEIKKQEEKS
jgi:hypothetical protein